MTVRKPATAEEIADALRKHDRINAGHALPYREAVDHLRRQLRTTPRNARDWLSAATLDDSHPFELVGTTYGKVYYVGRGPKSLLLDQAGYGEEDSGLWPYLSAAGEPVRDNSDDRDNREFVVLTEALQAMCSRSADSTKRERQAHRNRRAKQREGAEQKHGQSIAYIRGLLKLADVDPSQADEPRYDLTTGETSLSLLLMDDGIGRVAEVLAAHGIEPEPPTQIITRKPLQEATE